MQAYHKYRSVVLSKIYLHNFLLDFFYLELLQHLEKG